MCKVCDHPQREAIDRAIMAGDSCRKIAAMFATSKDAVYRHKTGCMKNLVPAVVTLPAYQTPADIAIERQNVRSVAQRAGQLVDKMEALAQKFEETGDTNGILKAAKEIREGLRLLAMLSGEIGPNQVNLQINNVPSLTTTAEWGILMNVLDRHPEIREELNNALREAGL